MGVRDNKLDHAGRSRRPTLRNRPGRGLANGVALHLPMDVRSNRRSRRALRHHRVHKAGSGTTLRLRNTRLPPRLGSRGQRHHQYLTGSPTVIVHPATRPLNPQLGRSPTATKPTDDGCLIVEPDDYARPHLTWSARQLRPPLHPEPANSYTTGTGTASGSRTPPQPTYATALSFANAWKASELSAPGARPHRPAPPRPPHTCSASQPNPAPLPLLPLRVLRDARSSWRLALTQMSSQATRTSSPRTGQLHVRRDPPSTMFITWQRTVGGRLESVSRCSSC